MTTEQPTVYLVDDDPSVRKALPRGLRRRGLTVEAFDSAQNFLDNYTPGQPGCLILDLSMPDIDGLELQQELINRKITIPIIFITGHGGVQQSVQALRAGAIDFLEKPFLPDTLANRIAEAFAQDQKNHDEMQKIVLIRKGFERLTNREQEICQLILDSQATLSCKDMARELGISHRTVEQHRSRILEKTNAQSVSELLSLADYIKLTT